MLADFLLEVVSLTTDIFVFNCLLLLLRVWRVASTEIPSFRKRTMGGVENKGRGINRIAVFLGFLLV